MTVGAGGGADADGGGGATALALALGGGGASGPASSGGTVIALCCFAPTLTLCVHGFFFGALASIVCSPGSTGTASPQPDRGTLTPSRLISRPSGGSRTAIVIRARFGSSASARCRASCSRFACPCSRAAAAAARYVAHALA